MGEPFWADDPELWNLLYVNDFTFAKTTIEIDGDFGHDWDVQKAQGSDGANEVNKGYDPCQPKLTWTLYTEEHKQQYELLLAEVQPKPGKQQPPIIRVIHPLLRMHKKEKFRIKKIHILKPQAANQMQATWELLEYFAGPKKPAAAAQQKRADVQTERALQFRDAQKPSQKLLP